MRLNRFSSAASVTRAALLAASSMLALAACERSPRRPVAVSPAPMKPTTGEQAPAGGGVPGADEPKGGVVPGEVLPGDEEQNQEDITPDGAGTGTQTPGTATTVDGLPEWDGRSFRGNTLFDVGPG